MVYLEDCYLSFKCFNLKTGFRLLTARWHLASKITKEMWRFSLYANFLEELPKMILQQPQLDIENEALAKTEDEATEVVQLKDHSVGSPE